MITDKMLDLDGISVKPLNKYQVKDVMETDFVSINFTEKDIETQLHLLVDNNFLPVVDDQGAFKGGSPGGNGSRPSTTWPALLTTTMSRLTRSRSLN